MGSGLRDVKRRIRSVQSTKKITRAMELIAASRVQKAQQRMRASRPYNDAITAALSAVATNGGVGLAHDYLTAREVVRRAAVVVLTSDRGLAGPYSSSVLRQAEEIFAQLRNLGAEPVIYVAGRKGTAYFRFRQRPVAESWIGFSETPHYENAKAIADKVLDAYTSGEVDEIYVVYTAFVSSLTQRATIKNLLPLEIEEGPSTGVRPPAYDYEPDPASVLDQLLPRYIEVRLYMAMLEAAASEQAARRRAMSTATENATDLIDDLTRVYNRARQAEITQELMEVVGAAEAFSGSEK